MLLILSGVQSIDKQKLSQIILSQLQEKSIGQYTVSLKKPFMEIYEQDKLVYRPYTFEEEYNDEPLSDLEDDSTGLKLTGKRKFLESIQEIDEELIKQFNEYRENFITDIGKNCLGTMYSDPSYDLGITNLPDYKIENQNFLFRDRNSYSEIIENAKKKPFTLITGSFSKCFIDDVIGDLGLDNVKVLNVVRNPSVSFLLNYRSEDFFNSEIEKKDNDLNYVEGYVSSVILQKLNYVETIKFEDIISSGFISINGTKVHLTYEYEKYNSLITKKERFKLMSHNDLSKINLQKNNSMMLDFKLEHLNSLNVYDKEPEELRNDDLTPEQFEKVPKNFFSPFNYEPLTYEQIIGANS